MKKVFVAALLIAAGIVVHAESTPAKKELVAKVLHLQQPAIESLAQLTVQQPVQALMQQAGQVLQQRIPPDKRQGVAQDIQADVKKFIDETVPIVRERAVALAPSTIGVVLDERFTEDELKQLIPILESPVNRKFQQLNGEMIKSLMVKLAPEIKPQFEPKFRALDRSVGTRLGLPAPATAPASGPAARAPSGAASK